uniref:Uncharacterized protein n=2 Tax=Phlebotomus papatasi TaxID=29031 RepID=A0A1B0CYJ0_PHLPP
YEQGLEDYDEAAARLDNEEKAEKRRDAGGGNSPYTWRGGNNSWERTVNFIGDVVSLVRSLKSYQDTSNEATAQASLELARNSSTNSTESLIGSQLDDIDETASTTEVAEGRYIHGDPLKGYYDFVITEGSYKFWAAFQLATAALIIYSTFAAIYYSKVNPIVSDYDYVDYLGGRSLAGGRSFDGDNASEESESPSSWLPSLNSSWVSTAVHGFQFVMDAIEKIPQ